MANKYQNDENVQNLRELALKWLNKPNFIIKQNQMLEGRSGEEYNLDFVVFPNSTKKFDHNQEKLIVTVADLRKSAGTDVIRKIDLTRQDLRLKILLISNKFSVQARSLARRADVLLMSRSELESCLDVIM